MHVRARPEPLGQLDEREAGAAADVEHGRRAAAAALLRAAEARTSPTRAAARRTRREVRGDEKSGSKVRKERSSDIVRRIVFRAKRFGVLRRQPQLLNTCIDSNALFKAVAGATAVQSASREMCLSFREEVQLSTMKESERFTRRRGEHGVDTSAPPRLPRQTEIRDQPLRGFGLPFDTNGLPFPRTVFPWQRTACPSIRKVSPSPRTAYRSIRTVCSGRKRFSCSPAYGVAPAPGRNGLVVRGRSSRSSR